MKPTEVLDHYVTQTRMSEVASVPPSNVSRWFSRERVPVKHQVTFCVDSGGALKLSRSDLEHVRVLANLLSKAVALSSQ